MPDQEDAVKLQIIRIVLKDLSFETPMGQDVFKRDWQPEYKVKLDVTRGGIADGLWEVVMWVTVTASLDGDIAYVIEAQHAGVFRADGLEAGSEPLRRLLTVEAPTQIFPYLREAVENVAAKGGFPSFGLQPPDLEGWYASGREPESADAK
jgi:preprotein translocase subunit SecB